MELFYMLQACFDDSGKDTESPVFLIAGYFASVDDLRDLGAAWQQLLAKAPHLKYIKGYEAFGLNGEFTGWSTEARDRRLLEFVSLIGKYSNKGIAFVIDKDSFSLIRQLRDDDGISFRDPQEFAFVMSLSAFSQFVPDFGDSSVDIVFDRDLVSRKQAGRAYRRIFDNWPSDITSRFASREPHFEDDKEFPPLQAADLLAHCIRASLNFHKRYDRVRNSAVFTALRSIPTGLAVVGKKQLQYLRDRKEKRIERKQIFTLTKWQDTVLFA
jgi:Protein of unknown function (DUF3800)